MTKTIFSTSPTHAADELPPAATSRASGAELPTAGAGGAGRQQHLADRPALAALRLTDDDIRTLSRQGFVSREERGPLTFFKLRFRRGQQQVVRYIGDGEQAAAVRVELDRLQAERRQDLELARLAKTARRMLRDDKQELLPLVAAANLKFHGLALRRPRRPKTGP